MVGKFSEINTRVNKKMNTSDAQINLEKPDEPDTFKISTGIGICHNGKKLFNNHISEVKTGGFVDD